MPCPFPLVSSKPEVYWYPDSLLGIGEVNIIPPSLIIACILGFGLIFMLAPVFIAWWAYRQFFPSKQSTTQIKTENEKEPKRIYTL